VSSSTSLSISLLIFFFFFFNSRFLLHVSLVISCMCLIKLFICFIYSTSFFISVDNFDEATMTSVMTGSVVKRNADGLDDEFKEEEEDNNNEHNKSSTLKSKTGVRFLEGEDSEEDYSMEEGEDDGSVGETEGITLSKYGSDFLGGDARCVISPIPTQICKKEPPPLSLPPLFFSLSFFFYFLQVPSFKHLIKCFVPI
jgi:hypothetical protein